MTTLVLHVAETMTGGIASYFDEMLPAQKAALGEGAVQVLVPASQLDHCSALDEDSALTYRDTSSRGWRIFTLAWTFYKTLWTLRPEIVHAHSTIAGAVVRICCLVLPRRPRIVYCAHGWAWDREAKSWQKKVIANIEAVLTRFTDKVICISQHDHDSAIARGLPSDKLVTVLNGIQAVPAGPEMNTGLAHRNYLFVGRFDRQKGIDIFLDAMMMMGSQANAYAVGSQVLDGGTLCRWPPSVEPTGWLSRSRVMEFMRSVDALVVPSRWEGFGLVALEAMRAGCPVIAARVGGLKELVIDGETGFLFEPNDPYALQRTLEKAASVDLKAMGKNASKRFHDFYTADRMNSSILSIYKNLFKPSTLRAS